MKSQLKNLLILNFVAIFVLINCSKDPDKVPFSAPNVSFNGGVGIINSNTSVPIYSPFKVNLAVTKGTNPLKSITVKHDGIVLLPNSFKINGTAAKANPELLLNANKDSITNMYDFDTIIKPGIHELEFIIVDEKDSIVTKSLTITFTGKLLIESGKGLIVYNFSGTRNGGVDLFNAKVIAGTDPNAHLRDFGNVSPSNNSWVQKFVPLNGSIIKDIRRGILYSDIKYQEEVFYLFENGTNDVGSINTRTLNKGDIFIVKNQSSFFAISIDNISPTSNDNLDNYVISIKRWN